MSIINGKAKKFDGTPVDYVMLFEWGNGKCIGTSIPDMTGNWSFNYYKNLNCGITYIANGCEPITHGAYNFIGVPPSSGFLLLSYIDYRTNGVPAINRLNPSLNSEPTWNDYFSQTIDVALIDSIFATSGTATVPSQTKILDFFDINWTLDVRGYVNQDAKQLFTLEFIDSNNHVVAAIKSENVGNDRSGFWYGSSLTSLINNTSSHELAFTKGVLTFTNSSMNFENMQGSSRGTASFSFAANMASVVKMRASAFTEKSNNGDSGSWVRIVPQP